MTPVRICFVCLGNICRSPTAEGIMKKLVQEQGLTERVDIDSAGTGSWHLGELPDIRSQETAAQHGVSLTSRARRVSSQDFDDFDYLIAMDRSNVGHLLEMAQTPDQRKKIHLLRKFDPEGGERAEVPDPYQGGQEGFELVFAICERSCRGLLNYLRAKHSSVFEEQHR